MAEIVLQPESRPSLRGSVDWSAIWAGLFTFIGIWSVFGFLGFAVFRNTANPVSGPAMNVGMGIWTIILSAVAMYIAGHQTGRLAGLDGRYEKAMHGMTMFGLAVTAAIVLTISGSMLFTGLPATSATIQHPYILSAFGGSEWTAFIALLLGWLSAMLGASSSVTPKYVAPSQVRDVRDIRSIA